MGVAGDSDESARIDPFLRPVSDPALFLVGLFVCTTMLIVTVELHSAITKETTLLERLLIVNDGTGTPARGQYQTFVGHPKQSNLLEIYFHPLREGMVKNHDRQRLPVWTLVRKALESLVY